MDLNESLKGWLQQQAQPDSFLDKAGLGLAQAGNTIAQDAGAGAAILNDPRNSWIGMNPLGRAAAGGLGLAGALMGQVAYHGSPHLFEKFALSKIGTGEGAQAFGHGLYFAENPKIAAGYAKVLPYKDFERKVAEVYGEFDHPDDAVAALAEAGLSPAQLKVMEALKKDDWLGFDYPHQALRAVLSKDAKSYDPSPETLKAVEGLHNIYKVDIPDDKVGLMLEWDKPLLEQPRAVKEALQDSGLTQELLKFYEKSGRDPRTITGGEFYRGLAETDAEASQRLLKAGIPGMKYLDAGSRGAGSGTHNYVIFDDQLPVIKERGGLGLAKE